MEEIARHIVRCISVDHIVKEVTNAIWRAAYLGGSYLLRRYSKRTALSSS